MHATLWDQRQYHRSIQVWESLLPAPWQPRHAYPMIFQPANQLERFYKRVCKYLLTAERDFTLMSWPGTDPTASDPFNFQVLGQTQVKMA